MMHAIIGTWKMSRAGIDEGSALLRQGGSARDAVLAAVACVEDDPAFTSVGYGGLPGQDGSVTLDAGYMDGLTLNFGGVMCVRNVRNPIRAAALLSDRRLNCLLVGAGAEDFAVAAGLPVRDARTESSMRRWRDAVAAGTGTMGAYQGHDTVCVIALDGDGRMSVGTSTSGLFMKKPGRVGDTPVIGSGFYCDARFGGAAATGLGEDIMRGCLSHETVMLMRRGATPQEACDEALYQLRARLREMGSPDGGMSLIALDAMGNHGASTTIDAFSFVAARPGVQSCVYFVRQGDRQAHVRKALESEIGSYPSD